MWVESWYRLVSECYGLLSRLVMVLLFECIVVLTWLCRCLLCRL